MRVDATTTPAEQGQDEGQQHPHTHPHTPPHIPSVSEEGRLASVPSTHEHIGRGRKRPRFSAPPALVAPVGLPPTLPTQPAFTGLDLGLEGEINGTTDAEMSYQLFEHGTLHQAVSVDSVHMSSHPQAHSHTHDERTTIAHEYPGTASTSHQPQTQALPGHPGQDPWRGGALVVEPEQFAVLRVMMEEVATQAVTHAFTHQLMPQLTTAVSGAQNSLAQLQAAAQRIESYNARIDAQLQQNSMVRQRAGVRVCVG